MNLLPYPRFLKHNRGAFKLPPQDPGSAIRFVQSKTAPAHREGYSLTIDQSGVVIKYRGVPGLRAGVATLKQLMHEYADGLPCLAIRDWPDFPRRGVMLDVSRGRVPKLETLLDLAERLAGFKINELQLYTEHAFAYRNYKSAWRDWGALTAAEIRKLDTRCRQLGIDLVPNQNSFGHLRYLLEHPRLKKLAEVSQPYEGSTGDFLRYPTTLAPNHSGTLKLLRELYDELLPNFSSQFFNVGCDETWDLGRGQSKKLCERRGKGQVYMDFLKRIHSEASRRKLRMMFWGDIILNHPELLKRLPRDLIALNWGYEANHPFEKETATFAKSGMQFYVCPGTSTWMSLLGRHENAFANLRAAAIAGRKNGAIGYLNCDWGDGGHPQPLAVSWPLYAAGAALSWCERAYNEKLLVPVLSREIYHDPSGRIARAALALGVAHQKFGYAEANITPFGAVIAAPEPHTRELFCRSGLKLYARIRQTKIQSALAEVENQRKKLLGARPRDSAGKTLRRELDLAARMAEASCRIMLWQQALAANNPRSVRKLARAGIAELRALDHDFKAYWPTRNKATTAKCSAFLKWRITDYQRGNLHFSPDQAQVVVKKAYAAE